MRFIFAVLMTIVADLYRRMIEVARMISAPNSDPVAMIVGLARAQVDKVASVFAKAPCSATGGTA